MDYIINSMSLEAPILNRETLDNIPLEKAQLELKNLGEAIAREVKTLKEASKVGIIITTLFNRNINYLDSTEVEIELLNIRELLLNLVNTAEIPEEADKLLIEEFIKTFVFKNPQNENELINSIDELLLGIIKMPINLVSKSKLFQKLKGECEIKHQKSVVDAVELTAESIQFNPDSLPLPINISYILNPEMVADRDIKLRRLKDRLQIQASLLFQHSASEYIEKLHGDELIDAEEEYYRQGAFYKINKEELLENSIPKHIEEGYPLELMAILNGETSSITFRQLNIAKIQLIRIYREFVNTIISSEIIDSRIVNEQEENPEIRLRVGYDEDERSESQRRKQTRRLELFNMWHMGTVNASQINPQLPAENLVPLSQNLLDFTGGKKSIDNTKDAIINSFTIEQKRRLAILESLSDYQFEEGVDGIPSAIYARFLKKLGIGTPDDMIAEQLELSDKKLPNTKFRTYTVKVRPGGTVAVDNSYRTLLIPRTWKPKLSAILKSIQHEAGHLAQQLSRDQSLLPGINILSGLGRSGTLAEAGAIKSEALMTNLLGDEREINTYHVDIVKGIIEGKNYWEIINSVLRILFDRNIRNNENKSKEDLVRTAIKTVSRAYGSLGAMGNISKVDGRYPTEASFLSYTYQGLPEFSNQPFYMSGIPAHRTDLQEFMPQPQVEGVPIDEKLIAEIIIDSAYEVLKEKGIIEKES